LNMLAQALVDRRVNLKEDEQTIKLDAKEDDDAWKS